MQFAHHQVSGNKWKAAARIRASDHTGRKTNAFFARAMCFFVVVVGFLLPVRSAIAADPLQILIPASPQPVERHAAEELSKYLGKITGKEYPIASEDSADPSLRAFLLGRTRHNMRSHNPDGWAPDTIYIGYSGGDIPILGQGSQGTLFATYEFLRDQGCRWYMPDHLDNELVPRKDSLQLPASPKRHMPSFRQRGWYGPPISHGAWLAHYRDWAVRNGLNTPALGGDLAGYGPERGHGRLIRPGHTMAVLIPSGDFPAAAPTFAEHPDWYPLVSGTRVRQYRDGRPVQACLSNPEVVHEVVRKVIEFFQNYPDFVQFSVSHSDEPTYWCECEKCRAMDGAGSRWLQNDVLDAYPLRSKAGPGPMSARMVKFVNQVARLVDEACPGKSISFLAYGSTAAPPNEKEWTLHPNVVIEYAYGDGWCLAHSPTDCACSVNVRMSSWLRTWGQHGNPLLFYDYPPTAGRIDIPSGFTTRSKSLITFTKRSGVVGWSGEGQCTWAGSGLWQYLKARLLWDAEADADALVAEYCDHMYGAAREPMRKFHQAFEAELQALPGHAGIGNWALVLPDTSIETLASFIATAESAADSEPARRRVAMMRASLNALVLARISAELTQRQDAALQDRYTEIASETVQLIDRFKIPVSDAWHDNLLKALR